MRQELHKLLEAYNVIELATIYNKLCRRNACDTRAHTNMSTGIQYFDKLSADLFLSKKLWIQKFAKYDA